MNILHLHVRSRYFDQIASGEKIEEYRLYNELWLQRLSRKYQGIIIYKGYPKKNNYNKDNIIERIWRGWIVKTINHPEFGDKPVKVFAIRVNP